MAPGLVTADTSVVLPLVSRWHEAHAEVVEPAHGVTRLPAHVFLEAVAGLTRLPRGLAVGADRAVRVLLSRFPGEPLILGAADHLELLSFLGPGRIRGGQVYDALIAATAKRAGARLLTRDVRARSTYLAVGVQAQFIG